MRVQDPPSDAALRLNNYRTDPLLLELPGRRDAGWASTNHNHANLHVVDQGG